jgi:hypothetical protein
LQARGLILRGITTDGSPLYPEPIATAKSPRRSSPPWPRCAND